MHSGCFDEKEKLIEYTEAFLVYRHERFIKKAFPLYHYYKIIIFI